jgi:hypothetical protein
LVTFFQKSNRFALVGKNRESKMKNTSQAICVWAGTAAFLVFLATPFFNGFLTPMSPNVDAADVVAFYQAHVVGIRIGNILLLCSPGLYIMFSAA